MLLGLFNELIKIQNGKDWSVKWVNKEKIGME